METFSALLAICAGNSLPDEIPAQRPARRSFDVFFDLRLIKRLSKRSWGWWCKTQSRPLWRHCNVSQQNRYCDLGNKAWTELNNNQMLRIMSQIEARFLLTCYMNTVRPLQWRHMSVKASQITQVHCLPNIFSSSKQQRNLQGSV